MTVAEQFWRDGVAVLEDLFSEDELSPISDEVDRVIRREVTYVPDADLVYEPGTDRLRNAFRLHLYEPFFMDFARKAQLVEVVKSIFGETGAAVRQPGVCQVGAGGDGGAAASGYAVLAVFAGRHAVGLDCAG